MVIPYSFGLYNIMCSSFDVVEKVRVPDAELQQIVFEQVERRATSPVRVPEGTAVPV